MKWWDYIKNEVRCILLLLHKQMHCETVVSEQACKQSKICQFTITLRYVHILFLSTGTCMVEQQHLCTQVQNTIPITAIM